MEFFEFFFSGVCWGWRLIGLIVLIYSVGYVINNWLDSYFTYKLSQSAIEESLFEDDTEVGDNGNSATSADVRD
jgi:hypothetical protein